MTEQAAADLERLDSGFRAAVAAAPREVVEARLRLGGRAVTATVAGRELADLVLAPFAHLRDDADGEPPELRIELWDAAATGVPLDGALPARGAEASGDGGVVVAADTTALTAIDRGAGRIIGWRPSAAELAVEERWRPLPAILPLWYLDRGIGVLHAAFVGRDGEGVLLVGPSGAGKSTTALACATAGMEMVGDDQVGLAEEDGAYRAHMLFGTARLWPEALERDPWLACGGAGERLPDGKLLVKPGPEAALRHSGRVRGMAILRTDASHSRVTPARPGEALLAIAPFSLLGVVGGGRWGMERIGVLVRSLPLRTVEVAGGPAEASALVEEAFEELRPKAGSG